ncbi:Tenascin-R [Liparis tanakae]|uniref:Tenascin-R n=1 Tax=Liparis tanakae TaxID=230148 RepID=A0A4Z2F8Q7_9TELE|nr:Tenascin-R [Liparis tanakae]
MALQIETNAAPAPQAFCCLALVSASSFTFPSSSPAHDSTISASAGGDGGASPSPHAPPHVAPAMNVKIRDVTDRTVDVEWEGSVVLTDILVTYTPSSPGGVQLEIRIPGNSSSCSISGLEAGVEYNINVFAVINNSISVPAGVSASTYLSNPDGLLFKYITETSVEVQWLPFYYSFDGWEISFIPKVERRCVNTLVIHVEEPSKCAEPTGPPRGEAVLTRSIQST